MTEIVCAMFWACNFLNEFQATNLKSSGLSNAMTSGMVELSRPWDGTFKVNSDGTICIQKNLISLEIVICDSKRNVTVSNAPVMVNCFSSKVAEALALPQECHFARDCGLYPYMFETDALSVVDIIKLGQPHDVVISLMVGDILALLDSEDNVLFVHCQANKVAHGLAKIGFEYISRLFLDGFDSLLCGDGASRGK
ncbi:hypothetical protein Ddye_029664 [Dipteronia dyeriana]|uniref:RNase H type-1 domain-containing protein n=1 Tax=Dipteronia dyeriana TaxID=168575 RepID=A0AAD9TFJ2_9ROSI|nr:hypothetical protein Ddye_029664 [Dipteronia dyeriana]